MKFDSLSTQVIGCAIEVHRELGPGLLESAYEQALAYEINLAGIKVERQVNQPINYKGMLIECGYRMDMLVEDQLIVELNSVECINPIHRAQLITYLKLAKRRVGLLINFNVPLLKDGIERFII